MSNTLYQLLSYYKISLNGNTMPFEIKNVSRNDLPKLFVDLGFKCGAEIGVWKGEFCKKFCEVGLHMTAVDSWVAYKDYLDHRIPEHIAGAYDIAKQTLAPYGDKCRIIKKFSIDAAKDVPDRSLDFAYVDGNHSFYNVVQDHTIWSAKVRSGGIVCGHDYKQFPRDWEIRVVEAVQGFVAAHDINPWFLLGRSKVRPGEIRDRERSYLWINP